MKKTPLTYRSVSFFVLIAFLVTNHFISPIYALPLEEPAKSFPNSPASIQIPDSLGTIQESYQGTGKKLVILVQDAHAVSQAQYSIQKVIGYFQKHYGLNRVALEGASSELDPQIFKSFPDKRLLKKAFEELSDRGELSGGVAAAVLNETPCLYRGVEDWVSYEDGLALYLKAAAKEKILLEKIDALERKLQAEKKSIYSKKLWDLDQRLAGFRSGQSNLTEVLKALAAVQTPPQGTDLALLVEEIQKEGRRSSSVNAEVKGLARQAATLLQGRDKMIFNQKYQQFQTSQITSEAFALFLKEEIPVSLTFSPRLEGLVRRQKRIQELQSPEFFRDYEKYAQSVKEQLFRSQKERALDRAGRGLELLERLARLEVSREDWNEIKTRDLKDREMLFHFGFYKNAEKREEALLRNFLDFIKPSGAGLLVAGGFHTQGLTRRLREKGISYLLLMPRIDNLKEGSYQNLYREHMNGHVSWRDYLKAENGKINLYQAFVRALRDRLLREPGILILKSWRDQLLRDLATQKKIEKAGEYTKFLDEAAGKGSRNDFRSPWRTLIERFLQNLRELDARHQFTEQNLLNLLKPATIADRFTNPSLLSPTNPPLSETLELSRSTQEELSLFSRSELRAEDNTGTVRSFGKTDLKFSSLGVGTIWFGRRWPPDNAAYVSPADEEIEAYLRQVFSQIGNQDGLVMVDTAAAYGLTEQRLGQFFKKHPSFFTKTFIATKWGEEFNTRNGKSIIDHSKRRLERSFQRSLKRLGRVDLLYIHGAQPAVLRNQDVMKAMEQLKTDKKVRFIGASISREDFLQEAVTQDLLDPLDVLQMPANLFLNRPDLIQKIRAKGMAIVLNSPIRKSKERLPADAYRELLARPEVSMILTGTRHHLSETIGYVKEALRAEVRRGRMHRAEVRSKKTRFWLFAFLAMGAAGLVYLNWPNEPQRAVIQINVVDKKVSLKTPTGIVNIGIENSIEEAKKTIEGLKTEELISILRHSERPLVAKESSAATTIVKIGHAEMVWILTIEELRNRVLQEPSWAYEAAEVLQNLHPQNAALSPPVEATVRNALIVVELRSKRQTFAIRETSVWAKEVWFVTPANVLKIGIEDREQARNAIRQLKAQELISLLANSEKPIDRPVEAGDPLEFIWVVAIEDLQARALQDPGLAKRAIELLESYRSQPPPVKASVQAMIKETLEVLKDTQEKNNSRSEVRGQTVIRQFPKKDEDIEITLGMTKSVVISRGHRKGEPGLTIVTKKMGGVRSKEEYAAWVKEGAQPQFPSRLYYHYFEEGPHEVVIGDHRVKAKNITVAYDYVRTKGEVPTRFQITMPEGAVQGPQEDWLRKFYPDLLAGIHKLLQSKGDTPERKRAVTELGELIPSTAAKEFELLTQYRNVLDTRPQKMLHRISPSREVQLLDDFINLISRSEARSEKGLARLPGETFVIKYGPDEKEIRITVAEIQMDPIGKFARSATIRSQEEGAGPLSQIFREGQDLYFASPQITVKISRITSKFVGFKLDAAAGLPITIVEIPPSVPEKPIVIPAVPPKSDQALFEEAEAQFSGKNFPKAIKAVKELLRRHPQDAAARELQRRIAAEKSGAKVVSALKGLASLYGTERKTALLAEVNTRLSTRHKLKKRGRFTALKLGIRNLAASAREEKAPAFYLAGLDAITARFQSDPTMAEWYEIHDQLVLLKDNLQDQTAGDRWIKGLEDVIEMLPSPFPSDAGKRFVVPMQQESVLDIAGFGKEGKAHLVLTFSKSTASRADGKTRIDIAVSGEALKDVFVHNTQKWMERVAQYWQPIRKKFLPSFISKQRESQQKRLALGKGWLHFHIPISTTTGLFIFEPKTKERVWIRPADIKPGPPDQLVLKVSSIPEDRDIKIISRAEARNWPQPAQIRTMDADQLSGWFARIRKDFSGDRTYLEQLINNLQNPTEPTLAEARGFLIQYIEDSIGGQRLGGRSEVRGRQLPPRIRHKKKTPDNKFLKSFLRNSIMILVPLLSLGAAAFAVYYFILKEKFMSQPVPSMPSQTVQPEKKGPVKDAGPLPEAKPRSEARMRYKINGYPKERIVISFGKGRHVEIGPGSPRKPGFAVSSSIGEIYLEEFFDAIDVNYKGIHKRRWKYVWTHRSGFGEFREFFDGRRRLIIGDHPDKSKNVIVEYKYTKENGLTNFQILVPPEAVIGSEEDWLRRFHPRLLKKTYALVHSEPHTIQRRSAIHALMQFVSKDREEWRALLDYYAYLRLVTKDELRDKKEVILLGSFLALLSTRSEARTKKNSKISEDEAARTTGVLASGDTDAEAAVALKVSVETAFQAPRDGRSLKNRLAALLKTSAIKTVEVRDDVHIPLQWNLILFFKRLFLVLVGTPWEISLKRERGNYELKIYLYKKVRDLSASQFEHLAWDISLAINEKKKLYLPLFLKKWLHDLTHGGLVRGMAAGEGLFAVELGGREIPIADNYEMKTDTGEVLTLLDPRSGAEKGTVLYQRTLWRQKDIGEVLLRLVASSLQARVQSAAFNAAFQNSPERREVETILRNGYSLALPAPARAEVREQINTEEFNRLIEELRAPAAAAGAKMKIYFNLRYHFREAAIAPLAQMLLTEPDPDLRYFAAWVLVMLPPTVSRRDIAVKAMPALLQAVHDSSEKVRGQVIYLLGVLGPEAKQAIPLLIQALKDPNEQIRYRACYAVGRMGPEAKAAVPDLIQILDNESDIGIRIKAIQALRDFGQAAQQAIPSLEKAKKDQDKEIHSVAVEALERIRERTPPRSEVRAVAETAIHPDLGVQVTHDVYLVNSFLKDIVDVWLDHPKRWPEAIFKEQGFALASARAQSIPRRHFKKLISTLKADGDTHPLIEWALSHEGLILDQAPQIYRKFNILLDQKAVVQYLALNQFNKIRYILAHESFQLALALLSFWKRIKISLVYSSIQQNIPRFSFFVENMQPYYGDEVKNVDFYDEYFTQLLFPSKFAAAKNLGIDSKGNLVAWEDGEEPAGAAALQETYRQLLEALFEKYPFMREIYQNALHKANEALDQIIALRAEVRQIPRLGPTRPYLEPVYLEQVRAKTPGYIIHNRLFGVQNPNAPQQIELQKGAFRVTLKREHLHPYDPVKNPEGLGLWKWLEDYEAEAKVATAGIRLTQNIVYPWSTLNRISEVGIGLATLAKALAVKELYPNATLVKMAGGEVRYNTRHYVDLISRIQAAQGIRTLIPQDRESIPIWMVSFLTFMYDLVGAEHVTSSHANSSFSATKDINNQGSQYLPEESLRFVAKIREIFEMTEREGKYEFDIAPRNHALIDDAFMREIQDGVLLYVQYLKNGVATPVNLARIRKSRKPILIENVGGSMYRTMTRIFEKLKIANSFEWLHVTEDPFFHGIGKDLAPDGQVLDHTQDTTIIKRDKKTGEVTSIPVMERIGYDTLLENKSLGTTILMTDPDGDRLVTAQIEPLSRKEFLDKLGVDYLELDPGRLLALYTPNQSFLMTMVYHAQSLQEAGLWNHHPRFLIMTTASSAAWREWAEANGVKVLNVPVGFKEIAAIMKKVEKQIEDHPNQPVVIRDVFGKEVDLGIQPRMLFAGEESGGMIIGPEEFITSLGGRKAIAMREKSAGEALVIQAAMAAYLESQGKYFSDYLHEIFVRDHIKGQFDVRHDVIYYNQNNPDPLALAEEKKIGEGKKTQNYVFYLSLALAYREKKITKEQVIAVLNEALQNDGLSFHDLEEVYFVGDGVFFQFPHKVLEIRPSGTDAKSKSYAMGDNKKEIAVFAAALGEYSGERTPLHLQFVPSEYVDQGMDKAWELYQVYYRDGLPADNYQPPAEISSTRVRSEARMYVVRRNLGEAIRVGTNHLIKVEKINASAKTVSLSVATAKAAKTHWLKLNETLRIGNVIFIQIKVVRPGHIKIGIEAPKGYQFQLLDAQGREQKFAPKKEKPKNTRSESRLQNAAGSVVRYFRQGTPVLRSEVREMVRAGLAHLVPAVEAAVIKSEEEDRLRAQQGWQSIKEIHQPVVLDQEFSGAEWRAMSRGARQRLVATMTGAVRTNRFIAVRLRIPAALERQLRDFILRERKNKRDPVKWLPDQKGFVLYHEGLSEAILSRNTKPVLVIRTPFEARKSLPQLDPVQYGNHSAVSPENRAEVFTAALLWISESLSKQTSQIISQDAVNPFLYRLTSPSVLEPLAQIGAWLAAAHSLVSAA